MPEVGLRVLALRNIEPGTKTAYVYGRGVYVGDHRPPDGTLGMFQDREGGCPEGFTNPKIELDNGGVIWGMQCWWGPEDVMDEQLKGLFVLEAPMPGEKGVTL